MNSVNCRIIALAIIVLVSGAAHADRIADLDKERIELEAERKLLEERTKLDQAKISEEYAKEKALKDIFGFSSGREGSITVGDGKTPVILRAQTAGADAVKELSKKMCTLISTYGQGRPYLITEAQSKAMSDAKAFNETASQAHNDLKTALEKVGIDTSMKAQLLPSVVLLAPVVANAIVSVAKLFREDYTVAPGANENFNALFDGFLSTTKICTDALQRPSSVKVREETKKQVATLTNFYQSAEETLRVADTFLKDKDSQADEPTALVKSTATTLRGLLATIKPSAPSSQLGSIAGATGLSTHLGKMPRLTYKLETQQLQVLKTGTFTGTKMERSGSAQAFYRLLDDTGQVTIAGYISYSTPQSRVSLDEAESHIVSSK